MTTLSRRSWMQRIALAWLAGAGGGRAAMRSHYEERISNSKPAGYWRLGEAGGSSARDASGNGRDGVYHGPVGFRAPGALKGDPDTAVKLDGRSAFIEIANHPAFSIAGSAKGLTVEAWMRPDVLEFLGETSDPFIHWLGKGATGRHEWALRFYSRNSSRPNRISAYAFNPDGGLGAGAYFEDPLTPGEWLHIVACFDPVGAGPNAGVSIYKNGVLRKGPRERGASGTLYREYKIQPTRGSAPVRLGTREATHFFAGALDEVAIYPAVLSAPEIRQHYLLGSKGENAKMQGNWRTRGISLANFSPPA